MVLVAGLFAAFLQVSRVASRLKTNSDVEVGISNQARLRYWAWYAAQVQVLATSFRFDVQFQILPPIVAYFYTTDQDTDYFIAG